MGFLYSLLGGIIISLLYLEEVFEIKESEFYSSYIFQNISFFVCFIIFIILVSILTVYIEIRGYPNISDKKLELLKYYEEGRYSFGRRRWSC